MEKEIWREIEGYPNYCVSNLGRVKSLSYNRTGKEQILKQYVESGGYMKVILSKENKQKNIKVHRLVAQAFLNNPDNLPCINHKDENRSRNFVYIDEDGTVNLDKSNLEFCTYKYNNNYGSHNKKISEANKGRKCSETTKKKIGEANSKPLLQIDPITNEVIAEWQSTHEVERKLGLYHSNISKCCLGRYKTCGGFKWQFK